MAVIQWFMFGCFVLFIVVYKALNTARESRVADARHAVGDGDGGQAVATIKGNISYAGHAVGDADRCQADASVEGSIAYAGHTIWDDKVFYLLTVHI